MKFSIVIPVYNVAPYLRECLDSILRQTEPDWECLCVDDGSTDGSGAILDEFASRDRRIMVRHQQNAGVSAARNVALDLAKGDVVCYVDADDWVESDWLANYAREFQDFSPDLVMITQKGTGHPRRILTERAELRDWGWNWLTERGAPWRYAVKRDIALKARFPVGVSYSEDSLYVMQLVPHLRIAVQSPYSGYNYRFVAGSGGRSKFASVERVRYLETLRAVHVQIPEIAPEMFSNAALGEALCWCSRPKDVVCQREIHALVVEMHRRGWIRFKLLRPKMRIGWLYLLWGWRWPVRAQDAFFAVASKVKRTLKCMCIGKGS